MPQQLTRGGTSKGDKELPRLFHARFSCVVKHDLETSLALTVTQQIRTLFQRIASTKVKTRKMIIFEVSFAKIIFISSTSIAILLQNPDEEARKTSRYRVDTRNGSWCFWTIVKSVYRRRKTRILRGINDISTVNAKIIDAKTTVESRCETPDERFHSPHTSRIPFASVQTCSQCLDAQQQLSSTGWRVFTFSVNKYSERRRYR